MPFAPSTETRLGKTECSLDGSQRFTASEVAIGNEGLDNGAVSKVGIFWRHATIISIVDEPCTEKVWNLAVLDDESYVANGLIVHNCRSVLFAVTAIDGWDGKESPPPTIEPPEGFK